MTLILKQTYFEIYEGERKMLSEMNIALIRNEMKFLFDRKNLEMILMGSKFVFDTKSYIELHHKIFAQ